MLSIEAAKVRVQVQLNQTLQDIPHVIVTPSTLDADDRESSFIQRQKSVSPVSIAKEIRARVEKILTAASAAEKAAAAEKPKEPVSAEKSQAAPEPASEKTGAAEKPKA